MIDDSSSTRGATTTRGVASGEEALGDRLLTVHEAASLLGVRPGTLYQWAYQRRLPKVKLFGHRGALRFRLSDINQLIAKSVKPALRSP